MNQFVKEIVADEVTFFLSLHLRIMRYAEQNSGDGYQIRVSDALTLCELFECLHTRGVELCGRADRCDRTACLVENTDRLKGVVGSLSIMLPGIKKLRKSIADWRAGKGKSLGTVMDEIRDKINIQEK
jgi:hypothetical protein